jgi:hypothetical protein
MTKLEGVLRREISIEGQPYTLTLTPEGLRLTLDVQLLLIDDPQEDGLTDDKVVEHVRRPAVADYLYRLVERHAHRAEA